MWLELIIAGVMVATTVVIHGIGLAGLGWLIHVEDLRRDRITAFSPKGLLLVFTTAIGIFIIHGIEIWLYAVLYWALDATDNTRHAVYLSALSFSGLGFAGALVADRWQLLAGLEGINGVILLGWSVAFFVTVMNRLKPR